MKEQSAVLLSGGVDSAVALAMLTAKVNSKHPVTCILVDYGQYNLDGEYAASRALAHYYEVEHVELRLVGLYMKDLPMLAGGSKLNESWELSEVPFRNPLMISLAAAYLQERGGGYLWTGIQPAPSWGTSYYDTSLAFLATMGATVREASGGAVTLVSPFIEPDFYSKSDIILAGDKLSVPWDLTHSCFRQTTDQCGQCVTCMQRARSFDKANIVDTRPIRQLV